MNFKSSQKPLCIMAIIFILGLLLILSSVYLGKGVALNALNSAGGMSTEEYTVTINSYIAAFRSCGIVVSLFGGLGTLMIAHPLFTNNN